MPFRVPSMNKPKKQKSGDRNNKVGARSVERRRRDTNDGFKRRPVA